MFKKPSTKIIKFIPRNETSNDYPPVPAKFELPEWYKNMSSKIEGITNSAYDPNRMSSVSALTGKRCIPVMDYMTSGYIIKINTDVLLSVGDGKDEVNFAYQTPANMNNELIGSHHNRQFPIKINGKTKHYIKFFSDWIIKTPPGYSTLFYQHHYLMEDRFTLFPAIVDTDTYTQTIGFIGHVNQTFKDTVIEAGTPLIVAFPFKRDEWQMQKEKEVYDNKNDFVIHRLKRHFENTYRKFYHSKKRYD